MPTPKQYFTRRTRHPIVLAALCCLPALVPAALAQPEIDGNPDSSRFILIPADTDDWTKHFRLGALVGLNISADFKMNGNFSSSGNNVAKGIYDDGYVRPDSETANDGLTGNWGYNNASQYNESAHTLTMSSTSQYTTSGSSHEDGGAIPGFELAYGMNYWYWKHARVGWELGFGLLPINISQTIPKNQTASAIQSTYTFDTGNIVVPGAPYQGGADGQGPLISTTHSASTQTIGGTVSGSHELDLMLYTVRLGPSFYWDLTDKAGFYLAGGPALGIASGTYKYDETITVNGIASRNKGQFSSTDAVYGGYVSGVFTYRVEDEGQTADIFVGAEYMPLGDASFNGSGRQSTLNLGGQIYLSAGISWSF